MKGASLAFCERRRRALSLSLFLSGKVKEFESAVPNLWAVAYQHDILELVLDSQDKQHVMLIINVYTDSITNVDINANAAMLLIIIAREPSSDCPFFLPCPFPAPQALKNMAPPTRAEVLRVLY